jgi:hypothetical protein
MMASSNEFRVVVKGKGAHAAQPHKGIDPVMVAVQIAQSWQTIISREKSPLDTAVLSITQIHAGSATNVIPDEAVLIGTVRTFTTEVLDLIERAWRNRQAHGGRFNAERRLRFKRNYPPLVNHARETAFAVEVMKAVVGADKVDDNVEPTMGAEDFAFMLQEEAGLLCLHRQRRRRRTARRPRPGSVPAAQWQLRLQRHLLPIGASYWVRLVEMSLRWLRLRLLKPGQLSRPVRCPGAAPDCAPAPAAPPTGQRLRRSDPPPTPLDRLIAFASPARSPAAPGRHRRAASTLRKSFSWLLTCPPGMKFRSSMRWPCTSRMRLRRSRRGSPRARRRIGAGRLRQQQRLGHDVERGADDQLIAQLGHLAAAGRADQRRRGPSRPAPVRPRQNRAALPPAMMASVPASAPPRRPTPARR